MGMVEAINDEMMSANFQSANLGVHNRGVAWMGARLEMDGAMQDAAIQIEYWCSSGTLGGKWMDLSHCVQKSGR